MRQIRTDLAMEGASGHEGESLPGVEVSQWESGDVRITEVKVSEGEGARLIGKAPGNYLTLELEGDARKDPQARSALSSLLGEELVRLLPPDDGRPVMVIGLGNRWMTPDALGPKAIERTLVTRHLFKELPHAVDGRMSSVCAVAPGVLGITGVETMETVKGLIGQVNPRCIMVIDALCAMSCSRVGCTVQLTDTGIQPGSGVGNHRSALTRDSLGLKVLAIGIPTVVYASTIARDALELLANQSGLTPLQRNTLDDLEHQTLDGALGEMIVTPRDIDEIIQDASNMLADGINQALQPGLSREEIEALM